MNQNNPVQRFFHVPPDGNPVVVPDLAAALAALNGGGYIWLNYLDPAREDLAALAGPLGLHPLAIEDCLDDEQIPKIEDYPTNTFVLFNKFHYEAGELFVDEVDLFLGKNFLVLVSHNLHGDRQLPRPPGADGGPRPGERPAGPRSSPPRDPGPHRGPEIQHHGSDPRGARRHGGEHPV